MFRLGEAFPFPGLLEQLHGDDILEHQGEEPDEDDEWEEEPDEIP